MNPQRKTSRAPQPKRKWAIDPSATDPSTSERDQSSGGKKKKEKSSSSKGGSASGKSSGKSKAPLPTPSGCLIQAVTTGQQPVDGHLHQPPNQLVI